MIVLQRSASNAKLIAICSAAMVGVTGYATPLLVSAHTPVAQAAVRADSSSLSQLESTAKAADAAAQRAVATHQTAVKALASANAAAKRAESLATAAEAAAKQAAALAKANPKSTSLGAVAKTKASAAKAAVSKAAAAKAAVDTAAKVAQADAKAAVTATAAAKAADAKVAAAKAAAASSSGTGSTAPAQKYKDGTYTGTGQTRIGAVQVQVTLKADKITNVQITGYTTHYSISYIDPILPKELVQRQDINKIDVISGATLSTEDFYYAVTDCLQQAQQAQSS